MKIPYLKNNTIEEKANHLLNDFYKANKSVINEPLDIIDIVEFLGYDIDFRKDGIYEDKDILGGLVIENKLVEINENISKQKGRVTFTIAHEIGHIVLHVPLYNKKEDKKDIICRKSQGVYGEKKQPEEVQADMFASYLIMPSDRVKETFKKMYSKPVNVGKRKLIEYIYPKSRKQKALKIASEIIETGNFQNVSKLAMLNRLIGLNLIKGIKFQKNRK